MECAQNGVLGGLGAILNIHKSPFFPIAGTPSSVPTLMGVGWPADLGDKVASTTPAGDVLRKLVIIDASMSRTSRECCCRLIVGVVGRDADRGRMRYSNY
ncbi:unnamed protein product [Sphagnum balticum]